MFIVWDNISLYTPVVEEAFSNSGCENQVNDDNLIK